MKKYDIVVIGSGSGMFFVEQALAHGMTVALVDKGPLGGTCPNLGCIPSKMLINPADRIVEALEARKQGITVEVKDIDFSFIMERMRQSVAEMQQHVRRGVGNTAKLDYFEGTGHFVADYTLEANGEQIKGEKAVFIASGSRPLIPPIKGLDRVDYLTNESILQLKERPASIIIIGGGYVAVEYAHFFASMGTAVTVIEMTDRLLGGEEPAISALLQNVMGRRMTVHTGTVAAEVSQGKSGCTVLGRGPDGKQKDFNADRVLVAVGRRSNSDLLKPENTGVVTDERGYIKVNEYLETTKSRIFASGDAIGIQMFTHAANREAPLAWHNYHGKQKTKMDFTTVPHAVFCYPQIASVGLTEEKARKEHEVLVGVASYSDVAYGDAMMETEGFAKAVVEKQSGRLLGFHIIGPYASMIIQEVTDAMAHGGDMHLIEQGLHIHPTLPELIPRTLENLE